MNISTWHFPIYLQPTFDELCELAKSNWDTCRVLVTDEGELVIASGYGNTHTSMWQALRAYKKNKYVHVESYIIYKEFGTLYMNLEDMGGRRAARLEQWQNYFVKQEHVDMLKDLARESSLVL